MRMKWNKKAINVILLIGGYLIGLLIVQHGRLQYMSLLRKQCEEPKQVVGGRTRLYGTRPAVNNTVMIGVMSTRSNLATRASAVYSTWGRDVSGLLVFYTGQAREVSLRSTQRSRKATGNDDGSMKTSAGSKKPEPDPTEPIKLINNLPVVELQGVIDEAYPPLHKSFAMIRHMYQHYGHQFQWFIRSDDDVYIRFEELVKYLLSVDNSRPWYIGGPRIEAPGEQLGLEAEMPYCMGGPGVVFSPTALRLLVPHLLECAKNTVTSHEDTELGRCVWQHLNMSCTSGKIMRQRFYKNNEEDPFADHLDKTTLSALTLHPVKDPRIMHKLHLNFKVQKLQEFESREYELAFGAKLMSEMYENEQVSLGANERGTKPGGHGSRFELNRYQDIEDYVIGKPSDVEETAVLLDNPVWCRALLRRKYFDIFPEKAHRSLKSVMNRATNELIRFIKTSNISIVKNEEIHAEYQSYTLTYGLQHIISFTQGEGYQSFLLSSKFEHLQWREIDEVTHHNTMDEDMDNYNTMDEDMINNYNKMDEDRGTYEESALKSKDVQSKRANIKASRREDTPMSPWCDLCVLVALYGRHQTYLRYLQHLSAAAARYPAKVQLRVALYADPSGEHKLSRNASEGNKVLSISVLELQGRFSRAIALNTLSQGLDANAVLVFVNVDLVLTDGFLRRVAMIVKPGRAYFPIFFSKFSPEVVCYGRPNGTLGLFDFSRDAGLWRSFSYGTVGITAADMRRAGGLDTRIVGRGKEDVDFHDRCLRSHIEIFRAPDVGLIHVFHKRSCDRKFPAS